MNEYIVYGMRRSGLHCICFDIIKTHKLNHIDNDIEFINDTDYDNYKKSVKNNKMFLFEDKFYKYEPLLKIKTVIIIRDIYDVIISRTKRNVLWSKIDGNFINTYIDLLNEILGYARPAIS